ncbi:MAG: HAD-IB family phosphatase [Thermoleophilia bacterium]|nr:HAD-IB family phosphatase [Thermoleophilia bacterium]
MLILCDFDGTVTVHDTNSYLSERFAPDAFNAWDGKLTGGKATLREVLSAEAAGMTAGSAAIVEAAVAGIEMRAGFREFVALCAAQGDELVLLSAGFRQLIEPMLEGWGLGGVLELIANDIAYTSEGGTVTWRDVPVCDQCDEPCKRGEVDVLRARSGNGEPVVYIGDGYSDRCGAETADVIIARAHLASYLDERGVEYNAFETFFDVACILEKVRVST